MYQDGRFCGWSGKDDVSPWRGRGVGWDHCVINDGAEYEVLFLVLVEFLSPKCAHEGDVILEAY